MKNEKSYLVIHPLDDILEQKMDPNHLGVMKMTPAVRLSLMSLRAYLILMILMLLYHVFDLAGIWKIKFF
jgi:hypothetical protein